MVVGIGVDRPPLSCVGSLLKRKRPGPVDITLSASFPVENAVNCRESYSFRGKDNKQKIYYLASVGELDLTGNGIVSDGEDAGGGKKIKAVDTKPSDSVYMIPGYKNRCKRLPRLVQPTIDGRGIIREATSIVCHACGASAIHGTDIHMHRKNNEKGIRNREKQQQLYISSCPR